MKTCTRCKLSKAFFEFGKSGNGYRSMCHVCRSEVAKEKRISNGDAIRLADRKRHALNPAARDEARERCRQKNPKKYNAHAKAWRDRNPAKRAEMVANRRAIKLKATPKWADSAKISEFYFAADFLGMVTGDWYHVDHIIPLQSKVVCGLHWEGNLQILTAQENQKKSNKFTAGEWPCSTPTMVFTPTYHASRITSCGLSDIMMSMQDRALCGVCRMTRLFGANYLSKLM